MPENTVKHSKAPLPVLVLCPREKVGGGRRGKTVVNEVVC